METRFTTPEDYPELVTWWKWFRFPAPLPETLPNNLKDGIMISHNGENVCAGFIYRTPSAFAWLEFIVSNPHIKDKSIRKESLELLINTISQVAKNLGFKVIFTSVKNENLINKYLDCGFTKESHSFEMVKML